MRVPLIIGISVVAVAIAVATAVVLISGSASDTSPTNEGVTSTKLKVVTSVAPITNMVKNVGCEHIDLRGVVPDGVDSHTFEPTPSDVLVIQDADLVIINGLNLEVAFERIVNAARADRGGDVNSIQLLKLADNTITREEWIFDFSFPEEKGDPNPHLWLNVAYAIRYVELVRDKLIEMDGENASYYAGNAERYIAKLRALDEGIMKAVQTIPEQHRKLLTYHDSWAYFAKRYGMEVIGAVQPSDFGEPTPQEVSRIIEQIREEDVPAIFASEVFPSRVMEQIARESGVKIVETLADDVLPGRPGDPAHTYIGMMLENMRNMIVPLGGSVDALQGIDPSDVCTG
ncbi:MAG: metal ABC transporter substrate-binding protein [Candidatus Nitrosocaldus sp.]|nr:metal ABC transporter substrate-binding protein [Candidatus Nitrosocaldus sp.]MDW7999971.1 metal ABC transporter substrate-binding protein [Candidatus Nitrosocaldus sp.]